MDPKENLVGSRADPLAGNVRSEGPTDATLGQFFDKFCFVNKTKLIENHCRQQDDNCLTTGPRLISFFNPKLSTQSGFGTTIQSIFFFWSH